jgi:hypothetical protein
VEAESDGDGGPEDGGVLSTGVVVMVLVAIVVVVVEVVVAFVEMKLRVKTPFDGTRNCTTSPTSGNCSKADGCGGGQRANM